jgi:hypothetical protein
MVFASCMRFFVCSILHKFNRTVHNPCFKAKLMHMAAAAKIAHGLYPHPYASGLRLGMTGQLHLSSSPLNVCAA